MTDLTVEITPDYGGPTRPLRHSWEGLVNIDQFRWLVRADVQEQLEMAHAEIGARHVRAVGMFDDEMRVMGIDPVNFASNERRLAVRPNWQVVDYVIGRLLRAGINPMFTTTFTPSVMATGDRTCFSTRSRIGQPNDYGAWAELVSAGARHAIDQFGIDVVRGWYFEVWNEPNLRDSFWDGSQADFHRLWLETYRAIKSVDAGLRVGGPSTARAEWIGDLIDFGRRHDCEPDYVIAHVYNNDSASAPLSPFHGPQSDRTNDSPHFAAGVVRGVRALLDDLRFQGEVHWNEWGRSWWPHFAPREGASEAAFIVKTMDEVSQLADRFAYWCLSDVYDQVGYGAEAFHGNYGLLNLHGLRKPGYHAHQFLNALGTDRLPAQITGAEARPGSTFGAIVTRSPRRFEVLAYSYRDRDDDVALATPIRLALPVGADLTEARVSYVGREQNNVVADWRSIGSPAYLRADQLDHLRENNALTAAPVAIGKNGGRAPHAILELPDPGIALVTVPIKTA